MLVVTFRVLKSGFGTSKGVRPQKVHSGSFLGVIKRAVSGPLRVFSYPHKFHSGSYCGSFHGTYLIINYTSRRYLKQSSSTPLTII